MIEIKTTVDVSGVTAEQVFDFMIDCTDDRYQTWWPGNHFRFHTVKHFPGNVGNIVYFDELIGNRRIQAYAVVREVEENRKIVWQLKSPLPLPVWIELRLLQNSSSLKITHSMRAGFTGVGGALDCMFRLFLSRKFELDVNEHADQEFSLLAKLIGTG